MKRVYCYRGFIVDKHGLHIKISDIVSFSYDEIYGQTNVSCSKDCFYMISDTDKSFFNTLLEAI